MGNTLKIPEAAARNEGPDGHCLNYVACFGARKSGAIMAPRRWNTYAMVLVSWVDFGISQGDILPKGQF